MAETVRPWKLPDPDRPDGYFVRLILAVYGAGWTRGPDGAWSCRLCEVEVGSDHEKGCPIGALEGSTLPHERTQPAAVTT